MSTSPPSASAAHRHMLGAFFVRHLAAWGRPGLALERVPQGLFLLWLAFMGLLFFGAWVLWQRGVWHLLLQADPTGLTVTIIVLFALCSLWAGHRAWHLGLQRQRLDAALPAARAHAPIHAHAGADLAHWCEEYWQGSARPGNDASIALALLGERSHGPHEMAWWLNGIQLKLGLLGKVIGFSVLALELGNMQNFDPSQSTALLKNLTGGLGIALLTTMTGLAGNILLGLQLMRLDRFADALVADTLHVAQHRAPLTPAPTQEIAHGDRPPGT